MNSEKRREELLSSIMNSSQAVSAGFLAERLNVSRQIIVGDVALLRASGHNIISTPRGYLSAEKIIRDGHEFTAACIHGAESTKAEIYTIIETGGKLIDVRVDHPIYGQLVCRLNIFTLQDADDFLNKIEQRQASLLCELTDGVHLHTISVNAPRFESVIKNALEEIGVLFK